MVTLTFDLAGDGQPTHIGLFNGFVGLGGVEKVCRYTSTQYTLLHVLKRISMYLLQYTAGWGY